jgi:predicted RNA-binding Zn-ribbon protein involved in translation (DUF1610 family)
MNQREPERPPRFCTNCGAKVPLGVSHCPTCGQPLVKREEIARLWGQDPIAEPLDESNIIDLYPESDVSLQATTPFTQTRPFTPDDRRSEKSRTGGGDSRSSSGGTLSKRMPAETPTAPSPKTSRGPHGCLLGCLGLLLIGAVAGLLAWGAVRPFVSDQVEEEISIGLSNELRDVERIPVSSSGRISLSEAEINQDLTRNAELYQPVEHVSVTIDPDEIAIRFELYGVSSTYHSGLTVEDGRLVVVDPSLSGPAGRIIDADAIGAVFEREVAELLRRSDLRPTNVRLRDGSIVVVTEPAV